MHVRLQVKTNELWALKTSKPAQVNAEISMFGPIRYSPDSPGDLELLFGARGWIR